MTIHVFAICYNESSMLPHFIKHYQSTPFNAEVTIFDNFSTDNSRKIIVDSNCNYKSFDTNKQIRDDIYLSIKNEAWKGSKADWVIVCDIDELLELNFDPSPYNIIRTQGYDMIGEPPSRLGTKNNLYSKAVMFRPDEFYNIGYQPGCHYFDPQPKAKLAISKETANLLHYKYISEDYVFNRHLMYQSRLSDFNKKYGFGIEYQNVERQKIEEKFKELRGKAMLI